MRSSLGIMKVDPLSHVMIVSKALENQEERKKLIVPHNLEGPYDRCCRQIRARSRISLLLLDDPGRGKSTFLFTILAKGPKPTYERRKSKHQEGGDPECVKHPEALDKIFELDREFFDPGDVNRMSDDEFTKLLESKRNIVIDDIHTLTPEKLRILKRALENLEDLNIIAAAVPERREEENVSASRSFIKQVMDRFQETTPVDPVDAQTLKSILKRRLEYALGDKAKEPETLKTIESVASTIAFFTVSAGGVVTPRKAIIYLRDYLQGKLLRDFEAIIQNAFEEINVRATMIPYSVLVRGIKDDRIEFAELRLTSDGIDMERIALMEPAVVGAVSYTTKRAQVRLYGRSGGQIRARRWLQIPEIVENMVVFSPEIIVFHVETSLTSVLFNPEASPPLSLMDRFNDLVRDIYYKLTETNQLINKQTVMRAYRQIRREVHKRKETQEYVKLLKDKLGHGSVDLAVEKLIIYRSLKAISEIFPSA